MDDLPSLLMALAAILTAAGGAVAIRRDQARLRRDLDKLTDEVRDLCDLVYYNKGRLNGKE